MRDSQQLLPRDLHDHDQHDEPDEDGGILQGSAETLGEKKEEEADVSEESGVIDRRDDEESKASQ